MPTMPKTKRPAWIAPPPKAWTHPNRWDGYNSRQWRNARLALLTVNQYRCATPGCSRPASHLDHIQPIASGHDPWDRANWQTLCPVCHSDKTNKERDAARRAGDGERGRGIRSS